MTRVSSLHGSSLIDPRARGAPTQLFHTTPFELHRGQLLRPRWSSFANQHKVWMSSSGRSARVIAEAMLSCFREGLMGFHGHGCNDDDCRIIARWKLEGLRIYRVRATGGIEREWRSSWKTAYPVVVLGEVGTFAEPEKNRLIPLLPMRDRDMCCRAPEIVMDTFRGTSSAEEFATAVETGLGRQSFDLKKLFFMMSHTSETPEIVADRAFSWLDYEDAESFSRKRTSQHRKLLRDPRYCRDKSRKGEEWDAPKREVARPTPPSRVIEVIYRKTRAAGT